MVDQGLVQYIRERLGEGYKEDYIREALRNHNHSEESIDEAFNHIHRVHGSHPLTIILLLLLLASVGVGAFLFLSGDSPEPAPQEPEPEPLPEPPKPSSSIVELAGQLKAQAAELSPDELYAESVTMATAKARTVGDGVLLCSVNTEIKYKNWCLSELADARTEPEYCGLIGDAEQRDQCYLLIIVAGEDQYCNKLVLEENKDICAYLLGEA